MSLTPVTQKEPAPNFGNHRAAVLSFEVEFKNTLKRKYFTLHLWARLSGSVLLCFGDYFEAILKVTAVQTKPKLIGSKNRDLHECCRFWAPGTGMINRHSWTSMLVYSGLYETNGQFARGPESPMDKLTPPPPCLFSILCFKYLHFFKVESLNLCLLHWETVPVKQLSSVQRVFSV